MKTIKVKYYIGDEVTIKPFALNGKVVSITISKNSFEYKVKYYQQNEQKYEWFEEEELDSIKQKEVGF